jgi:hypothetical protein
MRRDLHGLDAAGSGDLGTVGAGELLGMCPSCSAKLRVVYAEDPHTGRVCCAITPPVPFCTYFGETAPSAQEGNFMALNTRAGVIDPYLE